MEAMKTLNPFRILNIVDCKINEIRYALYISESMPNSEKFCKQKLSQMKKYVQKDVRKIQDGGYFRFGYISESMQNREKVL
jgi:hypothetical protein